MKLKTKLCKNKILPWFSTLQLSTQQKNKKKLLNRKIEIDNEVTENEIKMKFMLKENIGMSVDIAVVDMNKIR